MWIRKHGSEWSLTMDIGPQFSLKTMATSEPAHGLMEKASMARPASIALLLGRQGHRRTFGRCRKSSTVKTIKSIPRPKPLLSILVQSPENSSMLLPMVEVG